jgi:phosphatidylserine decarboxylase
VRVGIFLSVFNVHVNRSPCAGKVVSVEYKKGKFINAMRHNEASDENESNTIVLAEPHGDRPIAVVKQIVGLIARRIISTTRIGQVVERGERIGMIKFGSRTEVTLAAWLEPEIQVKVGQTVRGASDIIAILKNPIHTTAQPAANPELEPLIGRETPA